MRIETGTYLDRILVRTAQDLEARKIAAPIQSIRAAIDSASPPVKFASVLDQATVSVIAEFKRASPSKGQFAFDGTQAEVVDDYIRGGARGISCLTDGPFFQGSLADLQIAVERGHQASPPVGVLRKDFMIDPYQIEEARAHGADCILLIVAALDDVQLREFRLLAESLGMSVLVEIHDETERERALASGATLIGVNNRDLRTFNVDLATTERLAVDLSPNITLVSESGITSADDVARMAGAGAAAVLVGESLILREDRVAAVRELASVLR
jgi:indole-3-glycerol phosphate synthase